jgi:hypothetical protein
VYEPIKFELLPDIGLGMRFMELLALGAWQFHETSLATTDKRSGEKSTVSPSSSSAVSFRRDADFVDHRTSLDSRTLLEQIEHQCMPCATHIWIMYHLIHQSMLQSQ